MELVYLVATLAVMQFLAFGILTGAARAKTGIEAPAISGHPDFERMYRVQMNTLELMVAFIPALFLAAQYWPSTLIAGLGTVYLIGRLIFWRAYVKDPAKRAPGFVLSILPTLMLIILALVGIVLSLLKG